MPYARPWICAERGRRYGAPELDKPMLAILLVEYRDVVVITARARHARVRDAARWYRLRSRRCCL